MLNFIEITDINTKEIAIYHHLRENKFAQDRSFIADSPKVVNLLLEEDIEIKSILATQEYYDVFASLVKKKNIEKVYLTTKAEMGKIVGHKIHHHCMMHGICPQDKCLEDLDDKIIMLDNITSSENVGSIARSAAALGVNSYLLPTSSPHPFNRRALRVSMGHSALLKSSIYEDVIATIHSLQHLGYKVFAAEVSDDAILLSDVVVPSKWVILMGHEGRGIDAKILAECDAVVSIEMQAGIKSFNVGVAAALMMYKFTR